MYYAYCVQIGLIGLVEKEWIATLTTIDPDDVRFLDFVEVGRHLSQELKSQVISLEEVLLPGHSWVSAQSAHS